MNDTLNLFEEPVEATAALDKLLRNCPQPTHFGEYPFSTYAQKERIMEIIWTRYFTILESNWVHLLLVKFDVAPADAVIEQLTRILDYRRASGIKPVYHASHRGRYYPERNTKPRPPRP